jgi:phosphate starvation-inducible protein PhoH and related proteins
LQEKPSFATRRSFVPLNDSQREYITAIGKGGILFGVGPAGTGKTYAAVAMALAALNAGRVKRIIFTRPAIEAGEKLGFLPGTMQEKVDPYMRPLFDALHDMVDSEELLKMMAGGIIEIAPLAFMRGRTLSKAFVILDEAQNTTSEQMKMFLTRLGFGSQMVITGDMTQVDLPSGKMSGLVEAVELFADVPEIGIFQFNATDVVRNALVQVVVNTYESRKK